MLRLIATDAAKTPDITAAGAVFDTGSATVGVSNQAENTLYCFRFYLVNLQSQATCLSAKHIGSTQASLMISFIHKGRYNKCIGDDTKTAARQSPNCIKKYNMAKNDFQYGGWSYILQCGMWLWDDMPWNSPKHPLYWNFTSGFDFDHITAAVQHVHLTNIPVWFGLLGDV